MDLKMLILPFSKFTILAEKTLVQATFLNMYGAASGYK